ncbi:hypothetical protein N2152v2_000604 [Parachlorella kessleri]
MSLNPVVLHPAVSLAEAVVVSYLPRPDNGLRTKQDGGHSAEKEAPAQLGHEGKDASTSKPAVKPVDSADNLVSWDPIQPGGRLSRKKGMRAAEESGSTSGTGAVVTSGFEYGMWVQGTVPTDARIVSYAAGSSAVGVADAIATYSVQAGVRHPGGCQEAHLEVDSHRLITTTRGDKLPERERVEAAGMVATEGPGKAGKAAVTSASSGVVEAGRKEQEEGGSRVRAGLTQPQLEPRRRRSRLLPRTSSRPKANVEQRDSVVAAGLMAAAPVVSEGSQGGGGYVGSDAEADGEARARARKAANQPARWQGGGRQRWWY